MTLPRAGYPRIYSDPKQLYEQLLMHGMDYVTITDHDTIAGGLQIAHLPRTFISEQVTTYFPNDPCKLHILVWGISEPQHHEIEGVRDNIFELQRYLQTTQIAHAVAHLFAWPGLRQAISNSSSHLKHFQGINACDAPTSDLARLFSMDDARPGSTNSQTVTILRPHGTVEKDFVSGSDVSA